MEKSAPLVQVRDLAKRYDPSAIWMRALLRSAVREPVVALDGVSFDVAGGEICAVVGPNGAGKSTLFRVLTGLTTPTSGSSRVLGLDPERQSSEVRRVLGFVPADDRSLYLRHTARENLVFHAHLQGLPRRKIAARVDECLELVDLTAARERVGFALSAGMRARLQLARALVHEPSVLILDEPTGAIDPVGSYRLLTRLEEITKERGLAVLLSSHRLEEIEALHDHVLLLDRGHLVHQGDLDSLRSLWDTPRLQLRFANPEAAVAVATLLGGHDEVEVVDLDPPDLLVSTTMSTGSVLGLVPEHLQAIESVHDARVDLREVLARLNEMPVPRSALAATNGNGRNGNRRGRRAEAGVWADEAAQPEGGRRQRAGKRGGRRG